MTQKNQLTLLGALVLIMAVVWYINRTTSPAATGTVAAFQNNYQLLAVENPQLHRDKMEAAEKTEYHSLGQSRRRAPDLWAGTPASAGASQASAQHEIFWLRHNSQRHFTPRIFVRR